MRIHLTFAGQDNQTHHVTGDWDSAKHAIEWAKEKFKALTGFPVLRSKGNHMHIEINCKNISSIDPMQLSSQNAYLRICVEMTTEQAIDALEGLLGSGLINNSIVKQSLKEHRPDLIESIEDDAVSNAGEAYCEQRDRMATS